jgi:putative iron-regulated protein
MLNGCGDDETDTGTSSNALMSDAVANYSKIVYASYQDSHTAAVSLDDALKALVAMPSPMALDAARQLWLDSREPYLQTEVYRFYEGPIDNETDGPEGLLNAWPLDEQYIDYVTGDDTAGVINDPNATIDGASLEALNEVGGEKNVATGYHAIEFLLWGQDTSVDGPGNRPHTDYVTDGSGTATNQDRRGLYLTTVSTLLLGHLEGLVTAWAEGQSNYRSTFETDAPTESFQKILAGMIILSGFETGGERLQAALDSKDQEDEHSCFADNTHRDMVGDVIGVRNVWLGEYSRLDGTTVSGTGIKAVVEARNADLAARLDRQIQDSVEAAEALIPPFDQEISSGNAEGNARVANLITNLRAQEDLLSEVFVEFELSIEIPE